MWTCHEFEKSWQNKNVWNINEKKKLWGPCRQEYVMAKRKWWGLSGISSIRSWQNKMHNQNQWNKNGWDPQDKCSRKIREKIEEQNDLFALTPVLGVTPLFVRLTFLFHVFLPSLPFWGTKMEKKHFCSAFLFLIHESPLCNSYTTWYFCFSFVLQWVCFQHVCFLSRNKFMFNTFFLFVQE